MARLFVTSRELDFINDINKELIKDIVGQKIYYYTVRSDVTKIHDLYEESIDKIFNPPIEIDARVQYQPQVNKTTKFGAEDSYSIEVYMQFRDLIEKDIETKLGDYFSYDATFFEIIQHTIETVIYGQIEHAMGVKLLGKQARLGQISKTPLGPTSEKYTDSDAVQDEFVQQRGFEENENGKTGDIRDLQKNGILDAPLSGPAKISNDGITSSFYDET